MKHSIIFIAFIVMGLQLGTAQGDDNSTTDLRFGVFGGVNFSQWNGDVADDNTFRTGFHIGGIIQTTITEAVSLQLEPQFSMEGYTGANGTAVRANFINIPAMVRLYSTEDLSVEAGPKLKIRASEKSENFDGEVRKTERVKTLWFGIVAGASYFFDDSIAARFRFSYTPSDIIRIDAGDTEGTSGILFQLGLAYMFN